MKTYALAAPISPQGGTRDTLRLEASIRGNPVSEPKNGRQYPGSPAASPENRARK